MRSQMLVRAIIGLPSVSDGITANNWILMFSNDVDSMLVQQIFSNSYFNFWRGNRSRLTVSTMLFLVARWYSFRGLSVASWTSTRHIWYLAASTYNHPERLSVLDRWCLCSSRCLGSHLLLVVIAPGVNIRNSGFRNLVLESWSSWWDPANIGVPAGKFPASSLLNLLTESH